MLLHCVNFLHDQIKLFWRVGTIVYLLFVYRTDTGDSFQKLSRINGSTCIADRLRGLNRAMLRVRRRHHMSFELNKSVSLGEDINEAQSPLEVSHQSRLVTSG